MKQGTIFVGIAAYNEEDVVDTIRTALEKASSPDDIHIGIVLQYPKGDFPDLGAFPTVKIIKSTEETGLGLGVARGLSVSLYDEEEYYLQIDAHTVFKTNWDIKLKENYIKLKGIAEKPMICSYVPYYYRDKDTNQKLTMAKNEDWEGDYVPWGLVAKSSPRALGMEDKEHYYNFAYGIEALDTPAAANTDFTLNDYEEQYFVSGGFLFTSSLFLKEIKYDPLLAYHEENVIALMAWTRGYRIFNIKDHVLWTRAMNAENARDVKGSWRESFIKKDENGLCFRDKVVLGTLRNKDILTGKVLGDHGSPTKELLNEYEEAAGLDYVKFYKDMYEEVEKSGTKYPAARMLYDLDRQVNGW